MAIKINIGGLKDGSQQLEFVSGSKELGLDTKLIKGKVDIVIDLFKSTHQLDLRIKISGLLAMECDRCLESFEKPFIKDFEMVYVQRTAREEAIDDDYIRTYEPFLKTIDITRDIGEMIILSVPMKRLPDENPDGSCSWCGKPREYWSKIIIDEDKLRELNE